MRPTSQTSALLAALPLFFAATGCAGIRHSFHEHAVDRQYRADYQGENRANVPGPAVVLPVQNCNTETSAIKPNMDARQSARIVFPEAFWKGLHLPGTPPAVEHGSICGLVGNLRDFNGEEAWKATPAEQQVVNRILEASPGKQSVIVPFYLMVHEAQNQTAAIRDSTGAAVGTYETGAVNQWEDGTVIFGVYVVARNGIIWAQQQYCGPLVSVGKLTSDGICDDKSFSKADVAVSQELFGFPWKKVLNLDPQMKDGFEVEPAPDALADSSALAQPPPAPAAKLAAATTPFEPDAELSQFLTPGLPQSCNDFARMRCTQPPSSTLVSQKNICDASIRSVNALAARPDADKVCGHMTTAERSRRQTAKN